MKELLKLAPPPDDPVGVPSLGEWKELEERYGCRFPAGYRWLIERYGNGRFADFFGFPSPFYVPKGKGISFDEFVNLRANGIRFAQREMPRDAIDIPPHPARPGIFPFGYTDNGATILWHVNDRSEAGPIFCLDSAYLRTHDEYAIDVPEFVYQWLTGKIRPKTLTPPDFFPLHVPLFTPLIE
jgi:hypothetical protein